MLAKPAATAISISYRHFSPNSRRRTPGFSLRHGITRLMEMGIHRHLRPCSLLPRRKLRLPRLHHLPRHPPRSIHHRHPLHRLRRARWLSHNLAGLQHQRHHLRRSMIQCHRHIPRPCPAFRPRPRRYLTVFPPNPAVILKSAYISRGATFEIIVLSNDCIAVFHSQSDGSVVELHSTTTTLAENVTTSLFTSGGSSVMATLSKDPLGVIQTIGIGKIPIGGTKEHLPTNVTGIIGDVNQIVLQLVSEKYHS